MGSNGEKLVFGPFQLLACGNIAEDHHGTFNRPIVGVGRCTGEAHNRLIATSTTHNQAVVLEQFTGERTGKGELLKAEWSPLEVAHTVEVRHLAEGLFKGERFEA